MGLWEYQECLALYWNKAGAVYGVRVSIKNQKLQVLDSAAIEMEDEGFARAFSRVTEKLLQPSTHLIVAGGSLESNVCFDLSVPPMAAADIKQAIQYELPRHIPCDPMEMVVSYRILDPGSEEENANRMLIRVYAVLKKDWNELVTEFTSYRIKIDAFLHPYLVMDPILSSIDELYLPDVDEDFIYARQKDSECRQMVLSQAEARFETKPDASTLPQAMNYDSVHGKVKDELSHYIPPMMLAAYGLGKEFLEGKNQLVPLPREMVPERFRRLRISFAILLVFTVLLLLGLTGRFWWDSWSRLRKLQQEKQIIDLRVKKLTESNGKLTTIDELIKEIEEAKVGSSRIAKTLHMLSMTIPKDMWLVYMSSRETSIDISVKSGSGQKSVAALLSLLNAKKGYKAKLSHSNVGRDGTSNFYINLTFMPPPTEQGNK